MSGGGFQLRPATVADCAALAQLHSACFPRGWGEAEFASFFERDGIVALLASPTQPSPACGGGQGRGQWQAEGFIFCWAVAGEAELLALGVRPAARGQGMGRALLAEALRHCAGFDAQMMHLEVDVNNEAAIGLYEAEGFEISGRRKGYYHQIDGRRTDALTMCKRLS